MLEVLGVFELSVPLFVVVPIWSYICLSN